jgi:ADP-heptose:LPS heptosyltransferase
MQLKEVKFDCRHFRGEVPCLPNKLRNKVCTCDEYDQIQTRILIIKLGALGDVIRTTPLVTRFKKIYPNVHITWITLSPEILPKENIDTIYRFDFKSASLVTHQQYDLAINLDKDKEACQLLHDVKAKQKFGFIWKDEHIDAATKNAEHKLITGFFDNISKENTKHYLDEIFEICHQKYEAEEYLLNYNKSLAGKWNVLREKAGFKPIVGLNTGCGKRWLTRLWPESYWIELINELREKEYYPVLLGGTDEDEMNTFYAKKTGAYYPGTFSLEEFIALTSNCDSIVTAVSMMMHIAMGLKKPLILFNNIFNANEFYMFNRGEIIEPTSGCDDFYGNACTRAVHCMNDISVERVLNAVIRWTPK